MCCCCGALLEKVVISFLEKRHPGLGVREIVRLLNMIRERLAEESEKNRIHDATIEDEQNRIENLTVGDLKNGKQEETQLKNSDDTSVDSKHDGKWRPLVFTLGLIYKLQRVLDDSWYDASEVFISEAERRQGLADIFGFYWHYLFNISWAMVFKKKKDEELKNSIMEALSITKEELVLVHVKDAENLANHAPDTTLIVHHQRKEIVLTICGTKITPAPSLGDIMLDLHADSADFLSGRAHQGMAIASENVLKIVEEDLKILTNKYPEYTVLVVGYSLGAGVSQLVSLALLQEGRLPASTQLYCFAYGPPPVFRSDNVYYSHPNIFNILHHNDGLATFSLHTLTKLFLQVMAVERLNISRCRIMSLLRRKTVIKEFDATGCRKHVSNCEELEKEDWKRIIQALERVSATGFDELDLVGGNLFIIKKMEDDYSVRHLKGLDVLRNMSSNLKLRSDCFSDHMPWGYGSLFKGAGEEAYDLDHLKHFT